MTGYHIRIGYNARVVSDDDAWQTLKDVVAAVRLDAEGLMGEALRERSDAPWALLAAIAAVYADPPDGDATLTIIEPEGDRPGEILQLASGSGRAVRELMRRAFCRCVILAMHRRGIEVSLVVA